MKRNSLHKTALVAAALVCAWAVSASAQSFTVLQSFGIPTNMPGLNPQAPLVQGPDGTLYGTAYTAEGAVMGTLFKLNTDGSGFTVLKWFTNSLEGGYPLGGLALSGTTLYGTTSQGGSAERGVVFKMNTDGTGYTVLKEFTSAPGEGMKPQAGVALSGGTLYGTTREGGSADSGMVFKVNTDGTGYAVLKSFPNTAPDDLGAYTNSGGTYPQGTLALSGTTLYGTASEGGAAGNGTVFKINTDGSDFAVLKDFPPLVDAGEAGYTNSGGVYPMAGVGVSGSALYGTTYGGGNAGYGTVFKVGLDGTGFAVLKDFAKSDGANPWAALTGDGRTLYGTTFSGGSGNYGTVFKVGTDGTGFAVLKDFPALAGDWFGSNTNSGGANPVASLVLAGSTVYGTAYAGGSAGYGTVFKVGTDGLGFTALKNFSTSDGAYPVSDLALGGGALYGTTQRGGVADFGTVFKVNTNGTGYTVLKELAWMDGNGPKAGVTLDGGTLYGTMSSGGGQGRGTVFKLNTDGSGYTVLKVFTGSDGGEPAAELRLDGGMLYGTTYGGGSAGAGTVFKVNTNGTGYTLLKSFPAAPWSGSGSTNSEGAYPQAGLTLSGSTLYGTTELGGSAGAGTVFKVNTDGSGFQVLHIFPGPADNGAGTYTNSAGAHPQASLTLSGSTVYGTTASGGSAGGGTLFKVNTDGTGFAVLKHFREYPGDGAYPYAGLTLDGTMLYGTTAFGGAANCGTVFQVNTDGTGYAVLRNLHYNDGTFPTAGLTLAGTTLYGAASQGGGMNNGTVFSLRLPPMVTSLGREGSDLVWGGTRGSAGGQYFVVSSTNVGTWRTNWVRVATNTFGLDGTFAVTNAVAPGERSRFFGLEAP